MGRRICLTAEACLYMRLPARASVLLGLLTRKRASALLARDLVALAREPHRKHLESVFEWAMNYGRPALVRRLIKALAASKPEHWALKIMERADSDLLLPRDRMTPDVQIMQTSASPPKNALICFTGNALKLNMPVQLFHCAIDFPPHVGTAGGVHARPSPARKHIPLPFSPDPPPAHGRGPRRAVSCNTRWGTIPGQRRMAVGTESRRDGLRPSDRLALCRVERPRLHGHLRRHCALLPDFSRLPAVQGTDHHRRAPLQPW